MPRLLDPASTDLPVGSIVLAYAGSRGSAPVLTRTRSDPWPLGSGDWVVKVEGHDGGIALTHVDVLPCEHVSCSRCGKRVSNLLATPDDLVVRAYVECPECIEAKA